MRIFTLLGMLAVCATAVHAQTTPPVTFDFATEEKFAEWTVIDGNPSATPYEWEYNADEPAASCYSNSEAADDWIISPAVALEAGKSYAVTVSVKKSSGTYDYQKFTITAGKEATAESQTAELLSESSFRVTYYTDRTATFTPTESGTYHFGVHCTSGRYNGTLFLNSMKVENGPEYPAAIDKLTATAGEKGELTVALQWTWPATNDGGGELANLKGAKIERRNDSSTWSSYSQIATVETDVVPGGTGIYVDNTLTQAGPYSYRITPYSTDGDAKTKTETSLPWVGEDTPMPVTGLTVKLNGEAVEIDFTKPTAGKNGGYLDIDNLGYRIVRNLGSAATTIEEAYKGALPYSDTGITTLGSYTYTVTPITDRGTTGESATSAAIVAGPAFTVPYTADLSDNNVASTFTLVDADKDGKTWRIVNGGYYSTASIAFSGTTDNANDWAISPKVALETGKAYRISFSAKIYAAKEENYKNIAVAIGKAATAEAMGAPIGSATVKTALIEEFGFTAHVDETGEYNIGLQAFGASNYNDVNVTKLSVEEIPVTPLPAGSLTATRGEAGAMEATVEWTNPTSDNAGGTLTAITKYEVTRDGETIVAVKDNAVPGATERVVDTGIAEAGIHTYTVHIYLGENSSEASAATEWVGFDTPVAVANLTATADGSQVAVMFDAPTATVNGGALETEGMGYRIKRNDEVIEESYTDALPYIDNVTELGIYTYSVAAVTRSGLTGEETASEPVVAGEAMDIPYTANFENKDDYNLMSVVDANKDNRTWSYSSYDDAAAISTPPSEEGDWLFTPRLNLSDEYRYKVTVTARLYRAWSESSYTTLNIGVGQSTDPASQRQIGTTLIDGAMAEPHTFEFELLPGESGQYRIGIQAMGNADYQDLYILAISVENSGTSGAESIDAESGMRYDRATESVVCPENGRLTVVNAAGIPVADSDTADCRLSVANLPKGVYVARLTADDGTTTQLKFIK